MKVIVKLESEDMEKAVTRYVQEVVFEDAVEKLKVEKVTRAYGDDYEVTLTTIEEAKPANS